jgi:hypothetical protein
VTTENQVEHCRCFFPLDQGGRLPRFMQEFAEGPGTTMAGTTIVKTTVAGCPSNAQTGRESPISMARRRSTEETPQLLRLPCPYP